MIYYSNQNNLENQDLTQTLMVSNYAENQTNLHDIISTMRMVNFKFNNYLEILQNDLHQWKLKENSLMDIEYSYNDQVPASTTLSRIKKQNKISKPEYSVDDKCSIFSFINLSLNYISWLLVILNFNIKRTFY